MTSVTDSQQAAMENAVEALKGDRSGKVRCNWAKSVVTAALLVWLAITWIHFGRIVIRFYSPLPFYDYWDTVSKIDQYRHFDIGVLWQQHSEHRIVFPEIIFATDYLLFQGREVLPIALSAAFYFCVWLIPSIVLYRSKQLSLWSRLCAIFLAGIVMGWEGGALLIAAPFLIVWPLMLVSAALALLLLTYVRGAHHSWMYLAAAVACCAVSTYSIANGLLVWPAILLAAWILRVTRIQFTILAASAAILIGLYFVRYHLSPETNPGGLVTHPFYAISFVAAYLGMPFTAIGPKLGLTVGYFALASYLGFVLVAFRRRLLSTQTGVLLLGFYLVCILTAATTAVGRMNPQDPAFGAATAHRYIVVPLVAHATLILTAAWLWGNSRYYFWVPFLSVFALAFLTTGRSPHLRFWRDLARRSLTDCQFASLAFEAGVDDPQLMGTVFPGAEYVKQQLPILRSHRLSTFADGRMDWLGKPASSVFPAIARVREAGAVTSVYPLISGLLVVGWTDSPRRIWHPQELVLLDEQKRIVGFGRKLPASLPGGLGSSETPQSIAWVGFVNLRFQSSSFSAYIIGSHGKMLIPAGGPSTIPPIRALQADELGPPVPSLTWNRQGSWIKNGPVPNGAPPISYFESYTATIANTGMLISAPFARPLKSCLVLASAHGSSAQGLSERLVNADTNVTIASAPLTDRYPNWSFWAITLPSDAQHLQIVAEDYGHRPEQWLAISEPYLCR